jgi:hypothetical protein
MKHWILRKDTAQAIIEQLDRNIISLSAAKNYYSAYGFTIKGNTKERFIRQLMSLVNA